MKKILLIIAFLLILVAIPATVFLVKQRQEIRQKAEAATSLYFEPATINKNVGDEFTVNVMADTGVNSIAASEVHVSFNAQYLQALSIQQGDFLPNVFVSGTVENGSASITVASSPTDPKNGIGKLAVITFKALANTSTPTAIQFASTTQISAADDPGNNVLKSTQAAQVTIGSAGAASPTPTPATTPQPSPSGGATPRPSPSPSGGATPRPTPSATPGANTIVISNSGFQPINLTIHVNDRVTWTNNDTIAHTTTSNTNVWDSGNIPSGQSFSYTFTSPGTFPYHCTIHPSMTGTITVLAGTGGGASPSPSPSPSASSSQTTRITSPASGSTTTNKRPTISGVSFPNALIVLSINTSPSLTSTFYANASGNWSYTSTTDIANGTYLVTVTGENTSAGTLETATATVTIASAGTGGSTASPSPSASSATGASATPRVSATPATSTGTGGTPASTPSTIPVTGSTTPTIVLIGLALAMLIGGTGLAFASRKE
jgi:plastocyanin